MAYIQIIPVKGNILSTLEYDLDPKKTHKDIEDLRQGDKRTGEEALLQTLEYDIRPEKTDKSLAALREAEKNIDTDKLMEVMLNYVTSPDSEKEQQLYATGINCDPFNAYEEYLQVQKAYGKTNGIRAHHGWQSFKADLDISADMVHKIGVELAEKAWGDRFQVVVTTHLDRAHLHNHFYINSVSFADGKKYYGNKASIRKIREMSDEICLRYGLPIIEDPKNRNISRGEYRAELRGAPTWRDLIKSDIDEAIMKATSFRQFYEEMKEKGYLFKEGKHFAVSPPGLMREDKRAFIRLRSLKNDDYTLEGIKRRLSGAKSIRLETIKTKRSVRTRRKLPKYMAIYYRYMYSLGLMRKKPQRITYYMAKKGQNMAKNLSDKVRYMARNKVYDEASRDRRLAFLIGEIAILESRRKAIYNHKYRKEDVDEAELLELTNRLSALKKEKRLCESITVNPTSRNKSVSDELNDKIKEEEVKDERRIRSCRSDCEISRTRP